MQATVHQRLVSHPRAAIAVAIGIVIAGIVVVASLALSTGPSQTAASVQSPAQAQHLNAYENMRVLEMNTWQIPYTAPRALTFEEIAFIESNTFQIPYVAPVLSSSDMRFLEENTLGYHDPETGSPASDRSIVNQAACSSEYIDRMQSGCKDV
jgi:hypothetical protein